MNQGDVNGVDGELIRSRVGPTLLGNMVVTCML